MDFLLREYLEDTSRAGPEPEGGFTGAAGGAACGDLARISLLIRDGVIEKATFGAEGCGTTRAACALVCETVEGHTALAAARVGAGDLSAALGGLSPGKFHAVDLAADALHRALSAAAGSGIPLAGAPDRGRERVLVALSGGVDSAVAALVERRRGADVVGVTLKLWADPETDGTKACCSPEAVVGARRLSHELEIPHFTLDLQDEFRRRVVGRFLDGYVAGETPNPCVLCNGEVRIAAMIDLADRLGADRLVTGHYARIVDDGAGPLLAAAADPAKDQGYMLAGLPTELLGRLSFPLAEMTKPEVRAIAAEHGLAVARKPESQDLCFLAGQGKRAFLRRHAGLEDRPGPIRDRRGRRLGNHRGYHNYTVGQRRGLGVAATEPLYVTAIDAATNTVTVGSREQLEASQVVIRDVTLHRDGGTVDAVRLRYRSALAGAELAEPELPPGRYQRLILNLADPFSGVAPGQAAVLMSGDRIVGHGTIVAGQPAPAGCSS